MGARISNFGQAATLRRCTVTEGRKKGLASVMIGGEYCPIKAGVQTNGQIKISLVPENRAEDLYSWVVYLENDSDERSPRITEFYGLDMELQVSGEASFNTLRGDDCTLSSFYPESFPLTENTVVTRSPFGGRSSNVTAFPYFDIVDARGDGIVCGIGWSGQWKLEAKREKDIVRLTAGFADCDFYLEPHEKVRSVRILLSIGSGGADKLRHRFVRLHRKYYSPIPAIDENAFFPVSAMPFDRYYWKNTPKDGGLNYFETEDAQLNIIKNAAECGQFNTYWLDACWFDGAFRTGIGNYRYGEGFPNGLRKLGETARQNGMGFVLWFEPVRAMVGTDIYAAFGDDPQKLIPCPEEEHFLVNLGDPMVWQYQFEHISKVIEENGVTVYRQDFNIDPYKYLRSIEEAGRVGMAQIRFVEGIYRLWDALLARFPGLFIDNCASGGRLLDVETNMRSIPLWRSDVSCRPSPLGSQNEVLGLSRYIPYHQGGAFDYTPYFLRSTVTTGVACEFGFLTGIIDSEKEKRSMRAVSAARFEVSQVQNLGIADPGVVNKALQDALSLRPYWAGDFRALTPPSDSKEAIVAYALHLEEENRGAVLIFRREEAEASFVLRLPYISPDKTYILHFSDEDLAETEETVPGRQLLDGLIVTFAKAPASLRIFYEEKKQRYHHV